VGGVTVGRMRRDDRGELMSNTVLFLGYGFSARAIATMLAQRGWHVFGTSRSAEGCAKISALGHTAVEWPGADILGVAEQASHIISSIPPRDGRDPVLGLLRDRSLPNLQWLGLLSTTGVYGDHQGAWVDEKTPLAAGEHRQKLRVWQNAEWMRLWSESGLPVHIFRLAGIYGVGRSNFDKLRAGTAHRIIKKDQVFSRIHVDDIAQTVVASIDAPNPGAAYNVADDEPAPPWEVTAYAAELLGVAPPPLVPFEEAEMSPMARTFWADNKRVRNDRIKAELGVKLFYPDYRAGLKAVLALGG